MERDGGGEVSESRRRPPLILDLLCYSLCVFFFFFQTRAWINFYMHFLIRPSLDRPFLLYIFLHWESIFKKRF